MEYRQKVDLSKLKQGPIRHQVLSEDFIQRVKNFKQALAEVETSSIESTLDNFQRDTNPETELILWEHITKIYQWSVVAIPNLTLQQKKQVLGVCLMLSTGGKDFSPAKNLTKEMIDEIVDRYQYD